MKKFNRVFQHIVNKIEGVDIPLHRYLFLFLAILSVRLCLEFFSNQRLFKSEDVLHIGLWFIFIVGAFMVQLHFYSKEKVAKIIRLVVCCFSIALTAPIIDMIVSQGKLSKMNYLAINSFSDLLWSYITIGGASLSRGATLGIRIEIILLVFASFNYIFTKTQSLMRSLIGTISIYTVLFLSGAIPFFLGKLNTALGLNYGSNDQSSIYLLYLLDLLLFLTLIYRYSKHRITFGIKLISIIRFLFGLGIFSFGAYLAQKNYPENWSVNPTTIYYFPLLFLTLIFLWIYENLGKTNQFHTKNYHKQTALFFLVFFTSSCVSFYTCFASMIVWGLLFFLYEAPLFFYRIPFLLAFFNALLTVSILLMGFLSFGAPLIGIPTNLLFYLLITSFSVYLYFNYRKFKLRHEKN